MKPKIESGAAVVEFALLLLFLLMLFFGIIESKRDASTVCSSHPKVPMIEKEGTNCLRPHIRS